ncbi:hypothetical protein ACOIX7_02835 [Bacillus cereus]|uniref:hypothetical protein n=1 Tax=Bacillus cereus TaxID=1396 RepID=UPI003CF2F4C2
MTINRDGNLSPNFNFSADVQGNPTKVLYVNKYVLTIPTSHFNNEDFTLLKVTSLEALTNFLDNRIKVNRELYEKERERNKKLENKIKDLERRLEASKKVDDQQGKGRPKLLSDKELELAYKHLQSFKEKKGRYNYLRTFRFMQINYAYEGSHAMLTDSLREKYSELLQISTEQSPSPRSLFTNEMLEYAYKYFMENLKVDEDGKRIFSFTKMNKYMQKNYGYYGGVEQLKEKLTVKYRKEKNSPKINLTGMDVQGVFKKKIQVDDNSEKKS